MPVDLSQFEEASPEELAEAGLLDAMPASSEQELQEAGLAPGNVDYDALQGAGMPGESAPKRKLSSAEVMDMARQEPGKLREAFAKLKASKQDSSMEFMENASPVLRGAGRGGQAVGQFITNSAMRGLSYLPGLEHLSDKADHMNRVQDMQRMYEQYLDETGTVAEYVGPTTAKLSGAIGESASQAVLLSGAGRLTKFADSPKGMAAFVAAGYGAMDAERALTVAEDAGLQGGQRVAYSAGMGGITAGLTYAGGLLGDKFGGLTSEQLMSKGGGRMIANLLTRTGLRNHAVGMAIDGTEEEATAFAQAVYGNFHGMNTFEDYKATVGEAFVTGAAARGVFGAASALQQKYAAAVDSMPDVVDGHLTAQAVAEKGDLTAIPDDVKAKMENPDFKGAFEDEIKAIAELQAEVQAKMKPFEDARAQLDTRFDKLAEMEKEFSGIDESLKAETADDDAELAGIAEQREKNQKALGDLNREQDGLKAMPASESTQKRLAALEEARQVLVKETEAIKSQEDKIRGRIEVTRPRREKLAAEIAAMREKFNTELNTLQSEEADIKKGQDATQKATDPERQYLAQEMAKIQEKADIRGNQAELDGTVSAKHAYMERDRKFFGIDDLPEAERGGWVENLDAARAEGLPARAMEIAQRSLTNGEIWDEKTKFGVLDGYRVKFEKYLETRGKLASGEPDLDEGSLLKREKDLYNDIVILNEAMTRNGSGAGGTLNAQKFVMSLGGDPVTSLRRARRSKGSELTDTETKAVLDEVVKINETNKKLNEGKINPEERNELRSSRQMIEGVVGTKDKPQHVTKDGAKKVLTEVEKIKKLIEKLNAGTPTKGASRAAASELDSLLRQTALLNSGKMDEPSRRSLIAALDNLAVLSERMGKVQVGTPEFEKLNYELWEARKKLEGAEFAPATTTLAHRIGEYNALWHAAHLGMDLSFMGIQAGVVALQRPTVFFKGIAQGMAGGITSERASHLLYKLETSPNGDLATAGMITLLDEHVPLKLGEDAGYRSIGEKLAKFSPMGAAFFETWPRLYRTTINSVRMGLYDAMIESNGGRANLDASQLERMGRFVDTVTGRGGRGYLDKLAAGLSMFTLAPRHYASRAELVTFAPIWAGNKDTKMIIAKEYGRMFRSLGAMYVASALANMFANAMGEDDVSETNFDPYDPNFLRIKFGNTWLDPTFGMSSWIGAGIRAERRLEDMGGGRQTKREKRQSSDDAWALTTFGRGKLSKVMAIAVDVKEGKNIMGEKVTPFNLLKNHVLPISPKELVTAVANDGLMSQSMAIALIEATGLKARPDKKK